MEEFTFCCFTYNQEKYIIEHLESIKYQIENFGEKYRCKFLLADDASKDNTVELVRKWLIENKKYFSNVRILESKVNNGIVKNFIRALNNINTNRYKILAGDDIYYKNNIFQLEGEFCITPVIKFNEEIIHNEDTLRYKMMLKNKEKIIKFLQYAIKNDNYLDAPGIFMEKKLVDNGLISYLGEYSWIEDLPMWNYLLNNRRLKSITLFKTPYIMYRVEVGISSNKNHLKRSEMLEEEIKICNNIYIDRSKRLHYMIHKYRRILFKRLCKYYYDKFDADMIAFNNNMAKAENEATEYLALIRKNAEDFKARHGLK